MLSAISIYRRNQLRAFQLSSSVKSVHSKSINSTKDKAKDRNLGYYNTIVKTLTDETTSKNLGVTYYGNALSHVARYQDPSNFASVLSLVTKNAAKQENPLPYEEIRTVAVNAVLDAIATRPLSTSMSMWTEAAKQNFIFRRHELRSAANLLSKDSLNQAKKRLAENISFWRCHRTIDAHPSIAAKTTIFTNWQTLSDDEKRRQFLKFTQSLQHRKTPFSVSERQTISEVTQDMIDILKENSSLPVTDGTFATNSYPALRNEFPLQVNQILSHYAAHGLHEDMLFFFRIVSRALTEDDQYRSIGAILRSYNLKNLQVSSKPITHGIPEIEQHIAQLKKIQEEMISLIGNSTATRTALLQASVLHNLAQRYSQQPKSSHTNGINGLETPPIAINSPEETYLVQFADAQLRAYLQEAAQVTSASEHWTKGVADLMDGVVHLSHELNKEWMLVHSLSLLEELLSGKLSLSSSTGSTSTPLTLHIRTYKTLLSFADQTLQHSPLFTTLLYHGVHDFLSKYRNEWVDVRPPNDRRLLFPSVSSLFDTAKRSGKNLTKDEVDYILLRFQLNAKTNQHPEEALQWLREIRAHHRYLLPLPLFAYKQIVQNLSQIALLRPSQILLEDIDDTDKDTTPSSTTSTSTSTTSQTEKKPPSSSSSSSSHQSQSPPSSVLHSKQYRKFQDAVTNWKRASESLDFSLDELALTSHRMEDALARNPEGVAEWLLRTMRVQDTYGALTGKELAMVVPLFVPFAKHVVHAYRESVYRRDHPHVNGDQRKRYLALSHIPMDPQVFQEVVIDRVLRFLRKQLRQHLKDPLYSELRYLQRRPVFNELWYDHIAPQEWMVKNVVRLYCQAGLLEEAVTHVQSVHTWQQQQELKKKKKKKQEDSDGDGDTATQRHTVGVTASVLENIFVEMANDHQKRDHDRLDALLMQLVTSAALCPATPVVKKDIFQKRHVKKTDQQATTTTTAAVTTAVTTSLETQKKSFFSGFSAVLSTFASAFSSSASSSTSSSPSSSSTSSSSTSSSSAQKGPVVSQRMADAMVRAKIFDGQFTDALDLCLELYQQYGAKVSLGVLQMLHVVLTKKDAVLHESDRLVQVVSYLYPSEAFLLTLPETPEHETDKAKSAFARGNSGMRRARQWWRDRSEMKATQHNNKRKNSKKSYSSDI